MKNTFQSNVDRERPLAEAGSMGTAAELAAEGNAAGTLEELLDRYSRLLRDKFDLYYCGIFLLDEGKEYAILRSSPTEAGRGMIANNHRLRVGEENIVGKVAATGEPGLAADTGEEAVYFSNPLLPATHSEMALPLKSADGIIGVLDIQSDQPGAFSPEDIVPMQSLADQLAIAIERLRLLQQVQENLRGMQRSIEALPGQVSSDPTSAGASNLSLEPRSLSLRARLIAANILIVVLAILATGYYVYSSGQQANNALTAQMDTNMAQQARDDLSATGNSQAESLQNFFSTATSNISLIGSTAGNLLSHETVLNKGTYWDAATSLARLTNGSWDNAKTDPASIFIPAKTDLTPNLISELNSLKQLDFMVPTMLKANPDVVAIYFGGPSGETLYYPNISLASLVPPTFDVTGRAWYVLAGPAQDPGRHTVWSDPYLDAASHGLIVTSSTPIYDSNGTFRGVVAEDVQLNRITALVSAIHAGKTGYAFLIDKSGHLLAMPAAGYMDLGISQDLAPLGSSLDPKKLTGVPPALWQILQKSASGASELDTVTYNGVEHFVVYRPIPLVDYRLAIIVPSQEILGQAVIAKGQTAQVTTNTIVQSIILVGAILLVALLATLAFGNRLTMPLRQLTSTAEQIIGGNLDATAKAGGPDEIGRLALTFNLMTSRLRDALQGSEQRVLERTDELRTANRGNERRAKQFEALVQVTQAINSIRRTEELLPRIASVISEQFGYYHVGIFLNDEADEQSYLAASNSAGGLKMLERGHSLKIGEQGIVGHVAGSGNPRVARNVGEDSVFFNNPDLPETKSEIALPLRAGSKVVGILDVQSREEDAFSAGDITVLAILADQVSLAIDNTRLYETTRRSLEDAEALYRQYLRQAWNRLPREQQLAGFRYGPRGVLSLETPLDLALESPEHGANENRINVPIKLRGVEIGNLIIQGPKDKQMGPDQLSLIHAVADRVALSVENARLFDETSRRAERERMVTEITSKIRNTNDPEEMIQTALNELKSALGATQVQLIPQAISITRENEVQVFTSSTQDVAAKVAPGNGAKK
jgi:GAF domain-containing protein/HAMP domain-containing protein